MRSELIKVKDKMWKKQYVEELKDKVRKFELQLQSAEARAKNINIEVIALREENLQLQKQLKQSRESEQQQEKFKNEYKAALEDTEHFQFVRDTVNVISGMLVSKKSKELTPQ